ncbi:NAD(P)/FAD-dependent oxidoreductase [Sporosarcina sp. HYO08]|uniref:NAD(P)/FAD-dependent oxidoreductase n=1 Tax=Sporosarcina sp. HYO08 TaxID=1759557 RepID=UPI000792D72E|nr:FAD-dependent oxidoreductase [Sporosarcina sp. HYO08]KXH83912.1 sarcosine oxidase subunit alpha [Sporosarcina sp. HYO08]
MIDLLVVGAGPAGLSAAIAAAEQGLKVKVLDEFPKVGGRLLGQLHQEPSGEWWNGIEMGEKLHQKARLEGVNIQCEVSVSDISRTDFGWSVYTSVGMIKAKNLLLATGASETAIPLPGWTLPGAISIGAAQVMGNVHRVKPGNSCVIIGANVLSIAIANELMLCGVKVKEIIIPETGPVAKDAGVPEKVMASLMRLTHLAPNAFLRQAGKFGKFVSPKVAAQFFPKNGIRVLGIPIRVKKAAIEIIGEGQATGVRTVAVTPDGKRIQGTEQVTEADFVCIAGGLAPMSELASIAGCSFKYVEELGGHIPLHSERMETAVPGLYVAGNITGVESAKVAMAQGKVAGLTVAFNTNGASKKTEMLVKCALDDVRKTRANALIEFQPGIVEARERIYVQFEQERIAVKQAITVS